MPFFIAGKWVAQTTRLECIRFLNLLWKYDDNDLRLFVAEVTQLEDPRLEWLSIQEAMLRDYLHTAQEALEVNIGFVLSKMKKGMDLVYFPKLQVIQFKSFVCVITLLHR